MRKHIGLNMPTADEFGTAERWKLQ